MCRLESQHRASLVLLGIVRYRASERTLKAAYREGLV